jgi:hypothetical protein
MRWSDSIPIVEGEIGPPRSGFVHRLCIRKADGAWGEAARDDGPADTRFCRERSRSPQSSNAKPQLTLDYLACVTGEVLRLRFPSGL